MDNRAKSPQKLQRERERVGPINDAMRWMNCIGVITVVEHWVHACIGIYTQYKRQSIK